MKILVKYYSHRFNLFNFQDKFWRFKFLRNKITVLTIKYNPIGIFI